MIEIEFKYLIDQGKAVTYIESLLADTLPNDRLVSVHQIEQFYITDDDNVATRVRVSTCDTDYDTRTLTIKSANPGNSRIEIERELSPEEVDVLRTMAISSLVKTRYVVECSGWVWEFDVFGGHLDGLVYAEVEVDDENVEYNMPDCIEHMTLVDGREHSNAHLASIM